MRTPFWVASALLAIACVTSGNLWRELRAEREVSAGLRSELAEALVGTRADPAGVARADAGKPAEPALQGKPEAAPLPIVAGARSVIITGPGSVGEQELLKNPEYRQARLTILRSTIAQSYPGLVEELGLNTEEADRFFGRLAETQLAVTMQMPAVTGRDEQAVRAAITEFNRTRETLQRQQGDALRQMLGEARYAQWQAYQPTRPARMEASSHAAALAQAGSPLSDVQVNALVTSLLAERRSLQEDMVALGRTVDPANPESQRQAQQALRSRQAEVSHRILQASSGSLSAQQLSLLRAQLEQQDAFNDATRRLRERVP